MNPDPPNPPVQPRLVLPRVRERLTWEQQEQPEEGMDAREQHLGAALWPRSLWPSREGRPAAIRLPGLTLTQLPVKE